MHTAENSFSNDHDWGQGCEVDGKDFDLHCNGLLEIPLLYWISSKTAP